MNKDIFDTLTTTSVEEQLDEPTCPSLEFRIIESLTEHLYGKPVQEENFSGNIDFGDKKVLLETTLLRKRRGEKTWIVLNGPYAGFVTDPKKKELRRPIMSESRQIRASYDYEDKHVKGTIEGYFEIAREEIGGDTAVSYYPDFLRYHEQHPTRSDLMNAIFFLFEKSGIVCDEEQFAQNAKAYKEHLLAHAHRVRT
jgi:hypothetical protein